MSRLADNSTDDDAAEQLPAAREMLYPRYRALGSDVAEFVASCQTIGILTFTTPITTTAVKRRLSANCATSGSSS